MFDLTGTFRFATDLSFSGFTDGSDLVTMVRAAPDRHCVTRKDPNSPIAFAFRKEQADVWSILFVIRVRSRSCQLL